MVTFISVATSLSIRTHLVALGIQSLTRVLNYLIPTFLSLSSSFISLVEEVICRTSYSAVLHDITLEKGKKSI